MRSGSSELLLDQQQQQLQEQQEQELRIRKLKELAPKKSNAKKEQRTCKERASFYTTSSLVFFSVTAGASLLFLVPLYVDPAISTLASDFVDIPTICTTTRREDMTGIFNCSWSSCREGCTSDLYRCTHIYVTYIDTANLTLPDHLRADFNEIMSHDYYDNYLGYMNDPNTTSNLLQLTTNLSALIYQQPELRSRHSEEATLLVNIKGCGYPPSVTCKTFVEIFGLEGSSFPCYFSKLNRTLVMTRYNRDDQVSMIIHFFVVPFAVTVSSSILLCIIHCDCRCKKERPRPKYRRPRIENISDSSISTRVDMLTPAIEVYKPPPTL